jgi:Tol biopolymer transport system component
MRIRPALIALLASALCLTSPIPATASRGDDRRGPENGDIAFGRFDPALDGLSLWVAESDGSQQRRLTQDQANFSDWAPDGNRIAFDFINDTGVHIATIDPDGQHRTALTSAAGVQESPKWSPDGQSITYNGFPFPVDEANFSISIWVMDADGSDPRELTNNALDVEPVFSPDGTKIAFGRIIGDSPDGQLEAIYVINSDGTGLREVVAPRAGLEHPDWSPDGRLITFNVAPESPAAADSGSILAIRPDGSGLRILQHATTRLKFFKAVWSPDGRQMLSGCFDVEASIDRICTVSRGGRVSVVVGGPQRVNFPSWGPAY